MAALATSSQALWKKYDVFISFRGSDIRHGFLSHLTKQLRQKGIDVYVDERLQRGEEISSALLEAIERSIIALVIFSEDYSSSKWCLEELVKIMECKRVNSQIVIPVFYHVDPSHVRHQQGSYAHAFAKHVKRYEDDLLQLWRSTLKEAANLSGYHYSSNSFRDESDLIDEIFKDILKNLKGKVIIEPKHHLIGFEENLAKIESFLEVDSEEVGVIGIWGKGGAGKTTLARVVFDKYSCQFDSSCFASNVREESKKNRLDCLLDKIFSVLLNEENLTMRGRPNTHRRLHKTRVLLVLDDVDSPSQIKYLIDGNISLGPSSKVIITSRDKHVLVSGEVHVIHEVKELNTKESLQLFCWHAFKERHPKLGYEKLSAQAVQYAAGLPLALEVLGSYLNSKTTKIWESALEKLRKYPNVEIQTVLRVSYDGLDIPEKRIFLDIAFFFRGQKKENIIRVLDVCDDLYVDCGIDKLVDKALITISRGNRVEIHDLLQEMAEEIVREESREDPGGRSRLNDVKEIQDVLNNNKGTSATEGITLKPIELQNDVYLSADTFQKMSNLRFLKIEVLLMKIGYHSEGEYTVHLPHGLDSLSNKLRYLCWDCYPLESLPLGFSPKHLAEIHMPFSKVVKLWDGVQDLMNLKIINLHCCIELKELPDFSMAQNLEEVCLSDCENLCSIHPSMLSLPKLGSLNLMTCCKLKTLHGDKHMKSLKDLNLLGCSALEEFSLSSGEITSLNLVETRVTTLTLPVGGFNKLEELYIGGPDLKNFQINELSCLTSLKIFALCDLKEEIDKSTLVILFDAWSSLEKLRLVRCMVPEIPDNISAMSMLKILSLRGCSMESLPYSIVHLSKLEQIDLGCCKRLRSFPEPPPSTTRLYMEECTSLETIIVIPKMKMEISDTESSNSPTKICARWGLDGRDLTEFIQFRVIEEICHNNSCEFRVCYPGRTIPKGFRCTQGEGRSITIELTPSTSDHLLGFVSYCILHPLLNCTFPFTGLICRKFHFEDEDIKYDDEYGVPTFRELSTCNVFVWYNPMERILKGYRRSRFHEGTTSKLACEFHMINMDNLGTAEFDGLIQGCGIWPIYASQLQDIARQIELKLKIVSSNFSGPSAEEAELVRQMELKLKIVSSNFSGPSAEEAQHQLAAPDSVRRGTPVRQRTRSLGTSSSLTNKRSRNE